MTTHTDVRGGTPAMEDHTGLERLVFFSDAVLAIAITLLALEIRLPAGEYADNAALLAALLKLWPRYLSYCVSFLVIGSFWLGHHRMFRYIVRYDRRLLSLNLLLLLCIAFIPFPTTVLGEAGNAMATIFYAATMAATGLVSSLIWWYASAGGRLLAAPISTRALRASWLRNLTTPAVFLLSIPLAFFSSDLARYSWALIALAFVAQSDQGRARRTSAAAGAAEKETASDQRRGSRAR
ncbi:DUF1211 domain-containing protein [Oscillochloris sp. ZM17-4]|uniref:TMEM175 family protein n=1 Tax=Oscillochloris sp. ZM17-4 TaxID=2866714 RepID=UPI001C72FC4D|nr:TMEM175 family protein [Oscillochloris sp. ZM17-4]MBX0330724.1 DUF1211 domain-containing protein [Oscillochloris sp. ZM17-4]